MLGSTELLQRPIEGRRISQISNELSASQTSIGSVSSDIQQHLQSMFYLLRPEETLKMVICDYELNATCWQGKEQKYKPARSRSLNFLAFSRDTYLPRKTSANYFHRYVFFFDSFLSLTRDC